MGKRAGSGIKWECLQSTGGLVIDGPFAESKELALSGWPRRPLTKPAIAGGYAPVNGLSMYYETHGRGRPLVLLHGALSAIDTSFGEVLSGLAGLGDLVLTAYGHRSRNRHVGVALGQGRSIEEITSNMRMVAEGVNTARSTVALARKLGIEMPIVEKIHAVLYEGLKPQDAINDLMERKLREE